jgi:hypothetical protein
LIDLVSQFLFLLFCCLSFRPHQKRKTKMGFLHRFLSLSLTVSSLAAAQSCKLQFDGRLPTDLVAADLDAANDFFSNQFVIGAGLTVSQAVRILPAGAGSLVRPTSHNPLRPKLC